MNQHYVEICSDDAATLAERLDRLAGEGWHVLTVCWQARGAREDDQPAALAASGSFVIVCQRVIEAILRPRDGAVETRPPVPGGD
jgi:hypothetical protein